MFNLLLYILLLVPAVISPLVHAQQPSSDPVSEQLRLEEYACDAHDPASFKACIAEAQKTGVPFIKISSPITCTSAADCTFDLKNLKSYLKIHPVGPEDKFIRQNDFSYTMMNVEDSSQIEFNSLTFEDQTTTGCPGATACPDLLVIKNSSDIKFDKVNFSTTAGNSLGIADSRSISILNSNFKDSFKTAIVVTTKDFTENLIIEHNTFDGNAGTALNFQALALGSQSSIKNNNFTNNHSKGAYSNCLYPCTGAQMKITGPTSNLKISENTVSGGTNTSYDNLGLFASGIEIAGQLVKDTTLYCNEITGNRGSAVVQPPPLIDAGNISISQNKIWNNGLNLNIPTALADDTNCYTEECKLSCKSQ